MINKKQPLLLEDVRLRLRVWRFLVVVLAQVQQAGQFALADVVQQLGLNQLVGCRHQMQETHLQGDNQFIEVADLGTQVGRQQALQFDTARGRDGRLGSRNPGASREETRIVARRQALAA